MRWIKEVLGNITRAAAADAKMERGLPESIASHKQLDQLRTAENVVPPNVVKFTERLMTRFPQRIIPIAWDSANLTIAALQEDIENGTLAAAFPQLQDLTPDPSNPNLLKYTIPVSISSRPYTLSIEQLTAEQLRQRAENIVRPN